MSPDPATGVTPSGRSRLWAGGAVLATLLLLALAQPPAPAHGQPLSSTPAIAALRTGIAGSPAEATMLLQAVRTKPSLTTEGSAVLAARSSEVTTGDHHTTIAGIPAPLAVPVGAIILVLVIVVAVAARTRHRPDDNDRATFDLED